MAARVLGVLSKLAIESIPFEVVPACALVASLAYLSVVVEDLSHACKEVHVLADEGFDKVHRLFVFFMRVHGCFETLSKLA